MAQQALPNKHLAITVVIGCNKSTFSTIYSWSPLTFMSPTFNVSSHVCHYSICSKLFPNSNTITFPTHHCLSIGTISISCWLYSNLWPSTKLHWVHNDSSLFVWVVLVFSWVARGRFAKNDNNDWRKLWFVVHLGFFCAKWSYGILY